LNVTKVLLIKGFKGLKGTERDLKELKGTADEISSDPL